MTTAHTRLQALEKLVAKYQKSLEDFAAINEELHTLPRSERLAEIIALNETTIESTHRLLQTARSRLERERQHRAPGGTAARGREQQARTGASAAG